VGKSNVVPYKLRPNKSVDRELFISLLNRLGAVLRVEDYKYIGLGGPFLEDFRLIHARTGIKDMVSIEMDENTHKRQAFNKPIDSIECVYSSLEDYLADNSFDDPLILWLDYTGAEINQMKTFAEQIIEREVFSILRITMNANPGSLGDPGLSGEKLREWRLNTFVNNVGKSSYTEGFTPNDVATSKYGKSVLKVLSLQVDDALLGCYDRKIVWALTTHYSDGQPMVTATLIIVPPENEEIERIVRDWEFQSEPFSPLVLDLPSLSTKERLTMEINENPKEDMEYDLPSSPLKQEPFENFKRFYRVYPHYARIDL